MSVMDNIEDEYENKIQQLQSDKERLKQVIQEALSLCRGEWEKVDNHPAHFWAKEVEFFEKALKES